MYSCDLPNGFSEAIARGTKDGPHCVAAHHRAAKLLFVALESEGTVAELGSAFISIATPKPPFMRQRSLRAAHLMRVTETAHWLEWQDWAECVVKESFTVRDGKIEIPDRPGVGIEWGEATITRYAI
jgi:hypothetical protein